MDNHIPTIARGELHFALGGGSVSSEVLVLVRRFSIESKEVAPIALTEELVAA